MQIVVFVVLAFIAGVLLHRHLVRAREAKTPVMPPPLSSYEASVTTATFGSFWHRTACCRPRRRLPMDEHSPGMKTFVLKSIATLLIGCAVVALTSCATVPGDVAGDRAALLALHEEAMEAHRKSDVELLLRADADDFVLANRGEISRPSLEQRRQLLGTYLRGVRFSEYIDTTAPVVHVSADGSTGWLIAQVRAQGTEVAGAGRSLRFESAWIELYEKRDGQWRRVGNVSNFK